MGYITPRGILHRASKPIKPKRKGEKMGINRQKTGGEKEKRWNPTRGRLLNILKR
jgi:hypothetical protein